MGNKIIKNIEMPVILYNTNRMSLEKINIYLQTNNLLEFLNITINKVITITCDDNWGPKEICKYYFQSKINDIFTYDNKPIFKISSLNKMIIIDNNNIYNYFNSGTNTLLIHVTLVYNENVNFLLRINTKLFTNTNKYKLASSIIHQNNIEYNKKYINDYSKYQENMIKIHAIGILSIKSTKTKYFQYILTKVYDTNYTTLMFDEKIKLLINLLKFLHNIYIHNSYIYDLKLQNIGFIRENNNIIVKLIDYDINVIREIDNIDYYVNLYNNHNNFFPLIFGCTVPLYISKDFKYNKLQIHYKKSYVSGLIHIILMLFYYNNKNNIKLSNELMSLLLPKLDKIIIDNYNNITQDDINAIINLFIFTESNSFNKLLQIILINLASKDVNIIMEPNQIMHLLETFLIKKFVPYNSSDNSSDIYSY